MSKRALTVLTVTALAVWSGAAFRAAADPVPLLDPGFDVFMTGTLTPINDNRFAGTVGGPQTNQELAVASTAAPSGEFADVPAGWISFGGGNGRFRNDVEFLAPTGTMALSGSADGTVFAQNLGMPVAPNTVYTATIAVSDRNSAPIAGGTDVTAQSANPNLALLADLGGPGQTDLLTFFGGTLTYVAPPNGGTSIMTLIVTTGATVPAGNLWIAASSIGANNQGIANTHTLFDNATLDATGVVPEPGSLALLGLGGFAFALAKRRRSRQR